jgi:hypothetical protein
MLNNPLLNSLAFSLRPLRLCGSILPQQKAAVQRVSGRRLAHIVRGAAQLSRPLAGLLILLLLLAHEHLIFSLLLCVSAVQLYCFFPTKNPPVRAGSFALLMLSKPKIPDLDRAALLGFLGERNS